MDGERLVFLEEQRDVPVDDPGQVQKRIYHFSVGVIARNESARFYKLMAITAWSSASCVMTCMKLITGARALPWPVPAYHKGRRSRYRLEASTWVAPCAGCVFD